MTELSNNLSLHYDPQDGNLTSLTSFSASLLQVPLIGGVRQTNYRLYHNLIRYVNSTALFWAVYDPCHRSCSRGGMAVVAPITIQLSLDLIS